MVLLDKARSCNVYALLAKGHLLRTSSNEPSLSDSIIVPEACPVEHGDMTGTEFGDFRRGTRLSHLSVQDAAAIVSVAKPYIWSMLEDCTAQSFLSSWIMQSASTHKYRKPSERVKRTASLMVVGNSSTENPSSLLWYVARVVLNDFDRP
jgi:hypothetical protein